MRCCLKYTYSIKEMICLKNTFGSSVSVTIFGESHGTAIGAVLDGLAPGVPVDEEFIAHQMDLRKAVGSISTARHEADKVRIVSGVFNGRTTGTPITFIIENQDQHSRDLYIKNRRFNTANCVYIIFSTTILFRRPPSPAAAGPGRSSARGLRGCLKSSAPSISLIQFEPVLDGVGVQLHHLRGAAVVHPRIQHKIVRSPAVSPASPGR